MGDGKHLQSLTNKTQISEGVNLPLSPAAQQTFPDGLRLEAGGGLAARFLLALRCGRRRKISIDIIIVGRFSVNARLRVLSGASHRSITRRSTSDPVCRGAACISITPAGFTAPGLECETDAEHRVLSCFSSTLWFTLPTVTVSSCSRQKFSRPDSHQLTARI